MALKTGASHSLATLCLTLISALLIHFLRHVGLFENFFNYLLNVSLNFSEFLRSAMGVTITFELFPTIFVAAILAFAWGIVFQIARK
jgi:hypothetical protein